MRRVKEILRKLLRLPLWVLVAVSVVSFAALVAVFALQVTRSAPAYLAYCMSAYSLAILVAALPQAACRAKSAVARAQSSLAGRAFVRRLVSHEAVRRYLHDAGFRNNVGVCQGMAGNFLYALFCGVAGVCYSSAWFVSMAVYYLVLGLMRVSLVACYRRHDVSLEWRCLMRCAQLLFVLNIPMGGMIVLMVCTDSGFSYPGPIIYLAALYTFHSMALAVKNLACARRLGSPVLTAVRVLNLVAAMMSIDDLLAESVGRMMEQFMAYMGRDGKVFVLQISELPREELYLVTPQYLMPYLSYIKEHLWLFHTVTQKADVLGLGDAYERMFRHVFAPILERFGVPRSDREYFMAFYIRGLMAVVTRWVEGGCADTVEHVAAVMQRCVGSGMGAQV